MTLYAFILPMCVWILWFLWSQGDGPLTILAQALFAYACIFNAIALWMDNAMSYNSPLTQACAHGQPDVLRLLLQHG